MVGLFGLERATVLQLRTRFRRVGAGGLGRGLLLHLIRRRGRGRLRRRREVEDRRADPQRTEGIRGGAQLLGHAGVRRVGPAEEGGSVDRDQNPRALQERRCLVLGEPHWGQQRNPFRLLTEITHARLAPLTGDEVSVELQLALSRQLPI
jgi:hypothetical protein